MNRLRALLSVGWRAAVVILYFGIFALTAQSVIGLLFPGPAVPLEIAKVTHAENTAYNLKNAISSYFVEYREYPFEIKGLDLTVPTDQTLMTILCGMDHPGVEERNPRKIHFYSGRPAKFEDGRYSQGMLLTESSEALLWDPFGNHYLVRVDTNFDNQVVDPETPESNLAEIVAVWSAGPDGDFSTWKDNIKTW
ncbi:MAG: hypothetical protein AAGF67_09345 [Verrucomicrobiota bacterium]